MNILTFGEPLFLNYLSEPKICSSCNSFFSLGGSEVNTAVTLSNLRNNVFLLSVFPNNELGNEFINVIESLGINTRYVVKSNEDLIGTMYIKDNSVFYQRRHSAFSYISDVNLNDIFSTDYNWVHLTGITPMLSENCKSEWLKLLNKSLSLKIPISCDLNYRPALGDLTNLWNIVKPYINCFDLFLLSINDLKEICKLENIDISKKMIDKIMSMFALKFNIKRLVICRKKILEHNSQDRNSLMIYKNELYSSKVKNHTPVEHIGGGDAFVGSLINGILKNKNNILDEADLYTIESQNFLGNFYYK